jgi:hypothetical protein
VRAVEPPPRRPTAVPEAVDVRAGADTDGDARPDTLLSTAGGDLFVHTDLDGDGLADRILRIGPDGGVEEVPAPAPPAPADPVLDDAWAGAAGGTG